MEQVICNPVHRGPWNKGKLVGQKAPLKLKDIWAIRVRLQLSNRILDLALFNLAIDNKLRACDLVKLRVRDVLHGERIAGRTIVMQQKTQRPVQFSSPCFEAASFCRAHTLRITNANGIKLYDCALLNNKPPPSRRAKESTCRKSYVFIKPVDLKSSRSPTSH